MYFIHRRRSVAPLVIALAASGCQAYDHGAYARWILGDAAHDATDVVAPPDAAEAGLDVVTADATDVVAPPDGTDVAVPDATDVTDVVARPDATDVVTVPDAQSGYAAVVLADGPVAYYRLDETTGTTAHDASGHGLDGTYGASVGRGAPGLLHGDGDAAATFDGTHTGFAYFVRVPASAMLEPTTTLTVECWMSATMTPASMAAALVSEGSDGTYPYEPYVLQVRMGGRPSFYTTSDTAGTDAVSGTPLVSLRVYHVVGTFDGHAQRIYINGTLDTLLTTAHSIGHYDLINGLAIGAGYSGVRETFSGTIDEVAVYATALSDAQVAAHYAAGHGP